MVGKKRAYHDGMDSLIGSNSVFTGNIESEGSIRVDGKLVGDITVTGDVYIGEQAVVKGNIEASNVNLAGTIEGNMTVKGLLKVLSTAKLFGDIMVKSFVVDEGALFQGKCSMMNTAETAESEEAEVQDKKKSSRRNYKKSSLLEEVYENNSNVT